MQVEGGRGFSIRNTAEKMPAALKCGSFWQIWLVLADFGPSDTPQRVSARFCQRLVIWDRRSIFWDCPAMEDEPDGKFDWKTL
jgi:hypothetical protein